MDVNQLPKQNLDAPETDCCPKFDPAPWDEQEFTFKDKLFAKGTTFNFMHIPLTMGSMMKKTWKMIEDTQANSKDEWLLLSYDPSPWKGEHYFAVTKDVPGLEMIKLSGTYLTKVFEGDFKEVKNWVNQSLDYVKAKGKELKKLYFYYTTCPKCAKHYGKNYVVAFAQV